MYSNVLKCIKMYSNVFLENRNAVIKKAGWPRDGMMAWSYQRAGSIIDTR